MKHAVDLEAFKKAERKYQEDHGFIRSVSDSDQTALDKDVQDLKKAPGDVQSMLKTYNRDNAANEKQIRTAQPFQSSKRSYRKLIEQAETGRQLNIISKGKVLNVIPKIISETNAPKLERSNKSKQQKTEDRAPENTQTKKETPQNDSNKCVQSSRPSGSGLFIDVKVKGHVSNCLIDTGGTLNMMSSRLWDLICTDYNFDQFKTEIFIASGTPLSTYGKVKQVQIDINGVCCQMDVVITDMADDIIMGLDFMQQNQVIVDISRNKLNVECSKCEINHKGQVGCYRITVADKVELQLRTETVITGKVIGLRKGCSEISIVESNRHLLNNGICLEGRTLVHTDEEVLM